VAATRLDHQFRAAEDVGDDGGDPGERAAVQRTGEHQHARVRRGDAGECRGRWSTVKSMPRARARAVTNVSVRTPCGNRAA
jgi:hypothetical protein